MSLSNVIFSNRIRDFSVKVFYVVLFWRVLFPRQEHADTNGEKEREASSRLPFLQAEDFSFSFYEILRVFSSTSVFLLVLVRVWWIRARILISLFYVFAFLVSVGRQRDNECTRIGKHFQLMI